MRYLILTDIHANLEGLQTCLQDARATANAAASRLSQPMNILS